MTLGNINLHIDELVLHGFAASERYRIAEALEHELKRLLSDQGIPSALHADQEIAHLHGGTFEVSSNAKAEMIGIQVARAIYGGLGS
jgi:hypothetical protein